MPPRELPVLQPSAPVRERADARRNREAILCAAERLFAARGVEGVSMDDVAAAAGVGKGTLYRRFGDRGALVRALVEEDEREFQEACIRGAPPLGPGAPPAERLRAFGDGLLALLDRHGHFILAAEAANPGARFRSAVYQMHRMHVGVLLRDALGNDPRSDYLTDALLAPLGAETVLHQRARGLTIGEIRAGWGGLVGAILESPA